MIMSARARDPRLQNVRSNQMPQRVPEPVVQIGTSSIARTLPRIPRISQSSSKTSQDHDHSGPKTNKSSPSARDRNKSGSSYKSSRSTRKKSVSSDDSSPRKKSEEEKKFKSTHSRRAHSSKSPSKLSNASVKDVDLRTLPSPDSTTTGHKTNKDKLLTDLLNGEDIKSSHELNTTDENGKQNNQILTVTEGGWRHPFATLWTVSARRLSRSLLVKWNCSVIVTRWL